MGESVNFINLNSPILSYLLISELFFLVFTFLVLDALLNDFPKYKDQITGQNYPGFL
jgi:hypothetical protein